MSAVTSSRAGDRPDAERRDARRRAPPAVPSLTGVAARQRYDLVGPRGGPRALGAAYAYARPGKEAAPLDLER